MAFKPFKKGSVQVEYWACVSTVGCRAGRVKCVRQSVFISTCFTGLSVLLPAADSREPPESEHDGDAVSEWRSGLWVLYNCCAMPSLSCLPSFYIIPISLIQRIVVFYHPYIPHSLI